MAKSNKRVTRKQLLKEPDEFITFTGRMIRFYREYQFHILCGAAAVLVVILSVTGFRYYTNWQEKRAFASLEQALTDYKKAETDKSDLTAVKTRFQEVIDKYEGYAGGKMARVVYANICYQNKEYDNAISLYQSALEDFTADMSVRLFIQSSLGYSYEAKQEYQKAASYFKEIAATDQAPLKDEALFNMARLYDAAGDKDKSVEAYKKILSDYTDSPYIDIAKEKLRG